MAIPVAEAGLNQTVGLGDIVYLNAVLSEDTDNDAITAYQWTIVGTPNGSTSTLVNPTNITSEFTPDVVGNYVISLVVTANAESSVISYTTITVEAAPIANAVIDWEDVVGTDHTIDDGGYVGDLLTIARAHVDDAVLNNRLTNAQAGEIYTAMIPSAFQNGIGFAMQDQLTEAKIKNEQDKAATAKAQLGVVAAQEELYKRQRAGFDDNKHQKVLDTLINSWGITFQDTDTTFIPGQISQDGTFYKNTAAPDDTPTYVSDDAGFGINQAFNNVIKNYYKEQ